MSEGLALLVDFGNPIKASRKMLRIIIFSATRVPIATAVVNGRDTFTKAKDGEIHNSCQIDFRWIVEGKIGYKPRYFRIYPNHHSEIDNFFYWENRLNDYQYLLAVSNKDELRFSEGALKIKLI